MQKITKNQKGRSDLGAGASDAKIKKALESEADPLLADVLETAELVRSGKSSLLAVDPDAFAAWKAKRAAIKAMFSKE